MPALYAPYTAKDQMNDLVYGAPGVEPPAQEPTPAQTSMYGSGSTYAPPAEVSPYVEPAAPAPVPQEASPYVEQQAPTAVDSAVSPYRSVSPQMTQTGNQRTVPGMTATPADFYDDAASGNRANPIVPPWSSVSPQDPATNLRFAYTPAEARDTALRGDPRWSRFMPGGVL
ncbi:MAG: hypothetical protein QM692_03400, partial [Thermomicrobiales bacterium]